MNIWANAVITQKGLALQAKLIKGTTLAITKAVTGASFVTPGLLSQQTAVSNPKQELSLRPVTYPEEGKCAVSGSLTNDDLTTGYTAMQVGFYATDPDEGEILYFIAQAENGTGTAVPSKTEMPGYSAEWTFYFRYGQADDVNVTVDPSGYVSRTEIEALLAGKSDTGHKHSGADITSGTLSADRLPTVPLTKGGTGATTAAAARTNLGITPANIGAAKTDLTNVDNSVFAQKAAQAGAGGTPVVAATSTDGVNYTATVTGVTALTNGLTLTIIPNTVSTTVSTKLNVNGLGDKFIRMRTGYNTASTSNAAIANWLAAGKPIQLQYDGAYWIADLQRTFANSISGTVAVENGGTGATTAEQALANIGAAPASDLTSHTGNKNNPHNVTCDQIGAIESSTLGKPNGPAKLDADGKLVKDQLPPVGGSRITITFEPAFQGTTWTLTGGGENYSGVVDSTLKAVVPVMGVNTLYTVSAAVSGTTYTAEIATLDYFTALSVALTQFQATIIVTVDSGSTVTAVCGSTTLTKTSTGTAVFTVGKAGTWTITATKDGNTATGTVEITTSGQSKSLALDYAAVFGVCWDTSNSSTALTRLTKTSDPYGFVTKNVTAEPVPAVSTGAGSSPFDDYAPWNGMKECNLYSDGRVVAWKGESEFSRSKSWTMVYIPVFYVATKTNGAKKYFYVSDKAKTGFTKHPGSGKYVSRYHMNSSGYSRTGQIPYSDITRASVRSKTKSIGNKFHLYDFATYCAIIWLYIVEFADWNCQSKIGRGYVDNHSSAKNSGGTDKMTYHTGSSDGLEGSTTVQYRWIENLWGNVYQWVDGFNANGTTAYYCLDPSKYADDTTTGYTQIGTLPASGWIKDLTVTDNGLLIPKTVGGSETTFIPDYAYSSSGWLVLSVGGYWNYGSNAGLLYFVASNSSSNSYSSVSARLLCEA